MPHGLMEHDKYSGIKEIHRWEGKPTLAPAQHLLTISQPRHVAGIKRVALTEKESAGANFKR